MGWFGKSYEESEILLYLQGSKLACSSFMDICTHRGRHPKWSQVDACTHSGLHCKTETHTSFLYAVRFTVLHYGWKYSLFLPKLLTVQLSLTWCPEWKSSQCLTHEMYRDVREPWKIISLLYHLEWIDWKIC